MILATTDLSTAWWLAVRAFDSSLTYAYFLGMTGGAARTAFCGRACSCRDRWEAEQEIPAAVERMGYRVAVVKGVKGARGKGWQRLLRALARGRPAVWFDDATAGILTAHDAVAGTFAAVRVTAPGAYQAAHVSLEELRDASFVLLRRSSRPKGLRSHRELLALAEWVACALRPPSPLDQDGWQAVGLAAYGLWTDSLSDLDEPTSDCGPGSASGEGKECADVIRVRRWLDLRRAGIAFLRALAGRQRTPYAVRLRRAADLFEREVTECLEPLEQAFLAPAGSRSFGGRDPQSLLLQAAGIAAEATARVAEAAWIGMRLQPQVRAALQEPPDAPLAGIPLQEMIYLARAGTRPLRHLAARRLAGSDQPQAVATLKELLYDEDRATAETARWSLKS